jgi:hypothetical protein
MVTVAVGSDELHQVADQHLLLLGLPVEAVGDLARLDQLLRAGGELAPGRRGRDARRVQQVLAVVEHARVKVPGQRVHGPAVGAGVDDAGEVLRLHRRAEVVVQRSGPAGPRELGDPDDVPGVDVDAAVAL